MDCYILTLTVAIFLYKSVSLTTLTAPLNISIFFNDKQAGAKNHKEGCMPHQIATPMTMIMRFC